MSALFTPPTTHSAYLSSGAGELSCLEVCAVLAEGQSPYQRYAILDTVPYGRILVIDNVIQSAQYDEWTYHETFVLPAMNALERPRSVLILGGGEGAMAREVLRHRSVESVTMVDIDQEVVSACRAHLPEQHGGSFEDPRLTLIFDDARAWLTRQEAPSFDVILVDLTEPLDGGPSDKLFTREFYELIRSALAPGGVMALQAGSVRPGFSWAYARVIRTLEAVFPKVVPYTTFITSFAEPWGFALASASPLTDTDGEQLDRRLSEQEITPRYLDGETFKGQLHLPLYVRREIAAETRVATDEEPLSFTR